MHEAQTAVRPHRAFKTAGVQSCLFGSVNHGVVRGSHKGLFAHKLDDGTITDVQVEDPYGNSLPLPIAEYERRGIQPPADSLSDQHQYGQS